MSYINVFSSYLLNLINQQSLTCVQYTNYIYVRFLNKKHTWYTHTALHLYKKKRSITTNIDGNMPAWQHAILQKEIQKQSSCKKKCEKRCEILGGSQEMTVMVG